MSDEPKFTRCATPLLQQTEHLFEEIDIWRSAAILLKRYGADEGELIAARRADALLDQGDVDGFHVWLAIEKAVKNWRREKPSASEPMN